MEKAKTERARCVFEVKDTADGGFWVMLNIDRPGIGLPSDGFLGFEFRQKMTMKEADDFGALLNRTLKDVSLTTFLKP
jgi:hypothetical protein